jgi:hypothetical protein
MRAPEGLRGDHHNVRADDDSVARLLASPVPFPPFTAAPGAVWFILKGCLVLFHDRRGESLRAKISL